MSTAEIYMVVRGEGHFYVYNSVDEGSHRPPDPQVCLERTLGYLD